jgi:hypothetical protein
MFTFFMFLGKPGQDGPYSDHGKDDETNCARLHLWLYLSQRGMAQASHGNA